jgi:hypothetical protein
MDQLEEARIYASYPRGHVKTAHSRVGCGALTLAKDVAALIHRLRLDRPLEAYRPCRGTVIWIIALVVVAGCGGSSPSASSSANSPSNSPAASSSPTVSAPGSTEAPASVTRPTPTLVPFFDKLKANGSNTHFDFSKVLPGATCTVSVTVVPDGTKPWKTVTFTQRDFSQDLRPKTADRGGTVSWDVRNPPDLLLNAAAGTWTGDCRLYDRNQPDFLVYHQSNSLSFGSLPATSSTSAPASTHSAPPVSGTPPRSSTPSP